MTLPIRQVFKIFSPAGDFIGVLQGVTTNVSKTKEINSAGSQISFRVGKNMDTARLPVEPIETEAGDPLQTEAGDIITTEGADPVVGDNSRMLVNGNSIQIWESNNDNPNGYLVFRGYISSWSANIGSDEDIQVDCISDGQDLDQYVATTAYSVLAGFDGTVLAPGAYATANPVYNGGSTSTTRKVTQIWLDYDPLVTTYGSSIMGIRTKLAAQSGVNPTTVTLVIVGFAFNGYNDLATELNNPANRLATGSIVVSSTTPAEYDLILTTGVRFKQGWRYVFMIEATGSSGNGALSYSQTGDFFLAYNKFNGSTWVSASEVMYLKKIYLMSDETLLTFNNEEISSILKRIMDTYASDGGIVSYTLSSIENTGVNVTLEFQVATVLEVIRTLISLAPADFYWYVDDNNILHFKAAGSTPDHTFIKGRHLETLNLKATIQNVKNVVYYTGGKPTGSDDNIYVKYQDNASIAKYRRGLERIGNYQVVTAAVANVAAKAYVEVNKNQKYETTITIPSSKYNIAPIEVGQLVNLAGFLDLFVQSLVLQVVRYTKTSAGIRMTIGTLPDRQTIQLDSIARQLTQIQTIDNPNTAS